MKYIFFYATPDDIVPALLRFEENAPLKFVVTDISSSPNRAIYLSSDGLPDPGIARAKSGSLRPTYMVSHRDTKNHLHSVKSDDGRTLWSLPNGSNEDTVLLDLGGMQGSSVLLEGQMSTLHDTRVAQQLMRWFLSSLRAQDFMELQGCWIGPYALGMLKSGARLTQDERSPREYDLRWPFPKQKP